ncbi:34036_t:CDS:2 [Gigaspora margarita]|uniref:34036_t:CDS:1 n=1 Tax=Gigaspora margarita TaxID=4874 RepID=A0ABN7VYD1_GIGMA|nr:34036_t:CDS:2 [Gigaspora margarita]
MADILVVEQSLNEIDQFISSYTNKDNSKILEEQPLDVKVHNQNSVEIVNALVVEQMFSNWDKIDCYKYACEHQGCSGIKNKTSILTIKFPDAVLYLNCALFNEKERWALCYTSRLFTAKMQSTQQVKGQNSIIKSSVDSSTSLINLTKHIDEQIDRASTLIQYRNWTHSITGSTLIHTSSEFSSNINKWIVTYLSPTSLSMQRQKISQAVWYTLRLINNF